MYFSTYHWQPLVNGGGGFFPPAWLAQTSLLNSFPSAGACVRLRALGVRYIIIHPNFPGFRTITELAGTDGVFQPECRGAFVYRGRDLVYELAATSSASAVRPTGSNGYGD